MYSQHTLPMTKDENKDEHSGHSGHWTTQPSGRSNRGFFARMSRKARQSSEMLPQTFKQEPQHEEELAAKPVLIRSPSLPSIPSIRAHCDDVQKVSLFRSPPKMEECGLPTTKNSDEHRFLRRSPSLPAMNNIVASNMRQHQASPMAHLWSASRAATVSQNNLHNKIQTPSMGMTPLQKNKALVVHGSTNRAPLQCITPLGQKDLKLTTNISNHKIMDIMDKENMHHITGKKSDTLKMKVELPSGKEPTPEWKKNFMQQMLDDSPVGMVMDTLATKRPNTCVTSVYTKTARNLFSSDGTSPILPETLGIFKDNPQVAAEAVGYAQPYQFHDTPVPAKKFAQQSETFEFKQPSLPMQKPKETSRPDLIVVSGIPYRKGEKLGKGGSSDVYQVFRISDDAEFALKIVHLKDADENVRKGFLSEISFLREMQGCDRVIQLIDYELCEEQEVLFVIMERGVRDLSAFLKDRAKRKDLRISTVEAFWRDMVEAVSAIHDHGIIHSDLKPANFILCGEVGFHQLKIIDFGIASSIQTDMTSVIKDHPAGTLNYMSPEALQGVNVKINFKSDIWSLGCILYCLLYGHTPFQHIKNYGQKTAIVSDPNHTINFPEKSQILPGDGLVPQGLLQTVQACLSYRPQDRPSAKELLNIKYCGCEQQRQQNYPLEMLAQGLASLVREHRTGHELLPLLMAALQNKD